MGGAEWLLLHAAGLITLAAPGEATAGHQQLMVEQPAAVAAQVSVVSLQVETKAPAGAEAGTGPPAMAGMTAEVIAETRGPQHAAEAEAAAGTEV